MKVKDVIAILKEMDEELEVLINHPNIGFQEVVEVWDGVIEDREGNLKEICSIFS